MDCYVAKMAGAKPAVHVVQLRRINVPEILVKGNKFIKWDDVSILSKLQRVGEVGHLFHQGHRNAVMQE